MRLGGRPGAGARRPPPPQGLPPLPARAPPRGKVSCVLRAPARRRTRARAAAARPGGRRRRAGAALRRGPRRPGPALAAAAGLRHPEAAAPRPAPGGLSVGCAFLICLLFLSKSRNLAAVWGFLGQTAALQWNGDIVCRERTAG